MSRLLEINVTPLGGLYRIQRLPVTDDRGFLERLFCDEELMGAGLDKPIRQINRTVTTGRGTVRGLHFQVPPHAEIKIVACLRGAVFDVAVDLRQGSPSYLQWHGDVLSQDNDASLLIPEGFAHGFQTLGQDCELLYFHTASYTPQAESGLNALDPRLAIEWPEIVTQRSKRDLDLPVIDKRFTGIKL